MPADHRLQLALQRQDYEQLEEEWLALALEAPTDLRPFVEVAEALGRQNQEERAGALLELLDETLRDQGHWGARLELLQQVGRHFIRTGRVHEAVMETIQRLYAARQDDLTVALETVGLDKRRDETPKIWDKVDRLRNLLTYEVGTVVFMSGKGVGRVVEVNLALQTLKVDLESQSGVAVGFRAAGKALEMLAPGHFLRRKLEEPEALAENEPSALLHELLSSYDRPLSATEIREAVTGIVDPKRWSSWWASARKHPQVLAEGTGARQRYHWAESDEHARDHSWQAFETGDLEGQLDSLRKAQRDPELYRQMAEGLASRAEASGDPIEAFRIWLALERVLPERAAEAATRLLAELADPQPLFAALDQRVLRERAYTIARDAREGWPVDFETRFLAEPDPRALDLLASGLAEAAPERWERLVDAIHAQPNKAPAAFAWLAERAAKEPALRRGRAARLLRQILFAVGEEAYSEVRPRLLRLVETGGTVPRLLIELSAEEAEEAHGLIQRARGLEDYQREPLLNALRLRFTSLDRPAERPLYTTRTSLEAKRRELRELLEEEIPANRRAIEEARALGDLRENFEYKSARQRHEYLAARASELHSQLSRARVLDATGIDPTEIRIGTRASLRGANGESAITILGPWETAPDRGIISYESELAQELLGRRVGDAVTIGDQTMVVAAIERCEV
ncbi:MAG TPA: GreA/GreB family elongation factor [Thermoanaerobaculia bacterium]|nr:GreA/GreB family elongation factor [Thermoanaerobaculia bacterium]